MTEILKMSLRNQLRNAAARIEEFSKDLADNPCAAMTWADKAFNAAAEHVVAAVALLHMEHIESNGDKLEQLAEFLKEEVMRGGRWPSQSSSASSNLMAQHKLAAQVRLLEEIQHILTNQAARKSS